MPDSATRSRMMAAIRSRDTQPELLVRCGLHRHGLRFRLHVCGLPGCPDLVLPRWRTVIFVHGCFWHGHDCPYFHWPKTRAEFWRKKIEGTRQRDREAVTSLRDAGWRVLVVWKCSFRGKSAAQQDDVLEQIAHWVMADGGQLLGEFNGNS